MRSPGPAGVVVALAILSLLPASASAQTAKSQQGTPMSLSPADGDEAFGCESRFQPGLAYPGIYEKQPTGVGSCTAFQPGVSVADTHLVPGPGTVTKVRVRSGSNPAPLQVTVIKRLYQTNPNNPAEITDAQCCTGTGRNSATFQPTPNAVTEVTVNLPVTTTRSINGASGHHDIVAISGVGPGNLPIASTGEHSLYAGTLRSTPTMQIFYPKVETGLQGQAQHDYANYVVLMNYDWVAPSLSCASASGARASQACKARATVSSKSLRLKKGKVKVKVRCTAGAGARCRGTVRLWTRAKKPKLLASKKMNVAGGKKATITLKLSKKARKRLKKKSTKVKVEIDLGSLGKTSKNLNLKR